MVDYESECVEILRKNGPLLGSELKDILVENLGVTPTNARQIYYRLKNEGKLLTTDPVKFIRNQVLYFLPRQDIKKKLKLILPDHAKTLHRLYQAFVEQDGFLLMPEFLKISAGVIDRKQEPNVRHKSADQIFNDMVNLNLIDGKVTINEVDVIVANEKWVPRISGIEKKIDERIYDFEIYHEFTLELLKWMERINITGWNSTHLVTDINDGFNGYYWDAYGFSYLWGLYKSKNEDVFNPDIEKTGSVIVIESIIYRQIKKYDITGFIARISVLYGKLRIKDNFRIIPVCFAQSFEKEALDLARSKGIMIATVSEIFGTKIADALRSVRKLDPREFDADALVSILTASDESGRDGKFGALKGYVFNFLVASVFSNIGYSNLKIGRKYSCECEKCECDIVIEVDDYLLVCETKGYDDDIYVKLGETENEVDSVKKFFEKTCRIVRDSTGKEILPVFITSGFFTDDAIEYMESKTKTRKISRLIKERNFPNTVYFGRKELIDFFSNKQAYSEHKKVLKEFFKNHNKI